VNDLARLVARIEGVLPEGVAVRVRPPGGDLADLLPVERAAVARAVPKRREEFATGRALSRSALTSLGAPPVPIPVAKSREPVWPRGFTGSISHGADLVVAVVAPDGVLASLGIDVEGRDPLPPGTSHLILHPREVRSARAAGWPQVAVFSAKEAVHKALFPSTRVWMDFLDVEVLPAADGSFQVIPADDQRTTAPGLEELRGRLLLSHRRVVAVAFRPV